MIVTLHQNKRSDSRFIDFSNIAIKFTSDITVFLAGIPSGVLSIFTPDPTHSSKIYTDNIYMYPYDLSW